MSILHIAQRMLIKSTQDLASIQLAKNPFLSGWGPTKIHALAMLEEAIQLSKESSYNDNLNVPNPIFIENLKK